MSNTFRIQDTGKLVDRNGLKRAFPNVSFPKVITQQALSGVAADVVHKVSRPTATEDQTTRQGAPVQNDDGLWYENWIVQDRYTEYTDTDGVVHTVEEQKAAEQAELDARVAEANRVSRNKLLADSDWTQMNDSPLSNEDKTAWATYRQELRDMSDLASWPNIADDDWPVAP